MKLYMSMLYHQLGKKHRVEYNHKKFADKVSLECPMHLSAETLLPEYVYITGAEEWHVSILAQHIQTIFDNRTNLLTFPHSGENLHRLLQTMAVERQVVSGFDIERILAGSDWSREDRYRVIFLKLLVSPGVDINAAYLCSKIERLWKGSCTLQAEEGILWVLNLSLYADSHDYSFYDTLAYFLRESLCQAGISNIYSDLGQTALYYQQAQIALRIGGQQNPTQWYHYFADYALAYMLSQCTQQFPAEELCHPAVLALLRHDEQKNTFYYQTLKTYLDHRFSIVDTAETLFIHRTTLISRLKKIQKLYPLDLEDSQTVHHLMLSFALLGMD